MKTNQLLSVLCVMALSSCQAGRILNQSSTTKLNQSSNPISTATIDMGNLTSGQDLQVQSNPTPVPTATPGPTVVPVGSSSFSSEVEKKVLFPLVQLTLEMVTEANASASTPPPAATPFLPDSYQLYSQADLLSKLESIVGLAQVEAFQSAYAFYLSQLASDATTPLPASLQKTLSLSFISANGKTSSLTLPLVSILADNAAVITYGVSAYYGIGLLPSPATSVSAVALSSLSGATYLKVGSAVKVFAGKVGTSLNRAIGTITFSGTTFSISVSPSPLSTSSTLQDALFKPITSSVATAAGLSSGYIGNYVLIANVNSANKVYGFSLLKLSTGVITAHTASCASLIAQFSGYSCNVVSPTSTFTTTATSVSF